MIWSTLDVCIIRQYLTKQGEVRLLPISSAEFTRKGLFSRILSLFGVSQKCFDFTSWQIDCSDYHPFSSVLIDVKALNTIENFQG